MNHLNKYGEPIIEGSLIYKYEFLLDLLHWLYTIQWIIVWLCQNFHLKNIYYYTSVSTLALYLRRGNPITTPTTITTPSLTPINPMDIKLIIQHCGLSMRI